VGAYCLGGCDPKYSNSLESCVPAPVCESKDYSFTNLDGVVSNTKYLGDASKADWVSSGAPLPYNGKLLLTMAEGSVGTLLASTHYMWYGKVSAKLTTSGGKGVVTAFILLSDVKDEIDFEFVGTDLESAQSNFYSQGVTNCKFILVAPLPLVLTMGVQTTMAQSTLASQTPLLQSTSTKLTGRLNELLGR
jgi:beta-glucanase (GH16 family)